MSSFSRSQNGQIAVMGALCATLLVSAVGAGMDLSRAYLSRQKLAEVATLTCQYASRPSVVSLSVSSYSGSNGGATYSSEVQAFITRALQAQSFQLTQTNNTPFSYTQNGAADVSLAAVVPTTFMKVARVNSIPIAAKSHCYDTPSSVTNRVANGNSPYLVNEGFESGFDGNPGGYDFHLADGSIGTPPSTSKTFYASAGYVGANGSQWYIQGYCMEQDRGVILAAAEGSFSIELDCDNGSGSAGNSSISTQMYLPAGSYELRYNYAARVTYANYNPAYLCGSTAADLSWANDTQTVWFASVTRTNQMNVYLDLNSTGQPPTHTTLDGKQTLAGANLIDTCVYSAGWVERSVAINVTTAGFYWLSFAADGTNDSYGAQLDNVRFCPNTCPGSVQDNFPQAWKSSPTLFQDTFESPSYVLGNDGGGYYNTQGNTALSYGTSGSTSGWPYQSASGWGTGPKNRVQYWLSGCPSGIQCLQTGWGQLNSLTSRPFLLVPGYYQVTYNYVSEWTFSTLTSVYCGATPSAASYASLSSVYMTTRNRVTNGLGTAYQSDNVVGVFMSHAQLASTPNINTTYNGTTTYTNPDGSTSTTPTAAPNAINLTNYNAGQNNPLIDFCVYAATSQSRSTYIFIQKPAFYWLTFSALGTNTGAAGIIDNVTLTAVGSPYMSSPPASAVTIPVPAPQPSATVNFTGFSIMADRLTP